MNKSKKEGGSIKKQPKTKTSKQFELPQRKFAEHFSADVTNRLLLKKTLFQGCLKINQKNYLDAYVNYMSGENSIYIEGIHNRHSALDGDTVAVSLFDKKYWKVSLVDAIEFLNEDSNQALAAEILSSCDKDLFDRWVTARKIAERKSSVEKVDDQLSNGMANMALADKPDKSADGKRKKRVKKSKSDAMLPIKDLHIKVDAKVKEQCQGLQDYDKVANYNPANVFAECLRRSSPFVSTENGNNADDLSIFTAVQILSWIGALTVDVLLGYPALRNFVQTTGEIVGILVYSHLRKAVGHLKLFTKGNSSNYALFSPIDSRVPRMKIPIEQCPPDLANQSHYSEMLFVARIVQWNDPSFAIGEITDNVGNECELSVQKEALLLVNDIDDKPYSQKELSQIPEESPMNDKTKMEGRLDLRDKCIFTIDPSTAKDLDDAVSCKVLDNGNYEVGVHIADVSHYVAANSDVDKRAAERSTTYYLTDRVIPMLPGKLSESLCSLDSGKDKLTFSVVWELSADGTIVTEWIGKTIIYSCCKLSYDQAQTMIDLSCCDIEQKDFPTIHGKQQFKDVFHGVNTLNKLAIIIRGGRIKRGSVRLDQAKYGVVLKPNSVTPAAICFYGLKDSNKLIEEFMLMANIAVAKRICKHFPTYSLLRQHSKPFQRALENVRVVLKDHGVFLDVSSAGALGQSMERYNGNSKDTNAIYLAIVHMCSKPMQMAKYFCSGTMTGKENYHHYALNEPLYTHFTSPIRRYADIMVHRLLAAAIDPDRFPLLQTTPSQIQRQADHANNRKKVSKIIQEASAEIHLAEYIRQTHPLQEDGIIVGVLNKAVDVLLLRYSLVKRCYAQQLDLKTYSFTSAIKPGTLSLTWELPGGKLLQQDLSMFTLVTVTLAVNKDNRKLDIKLNCPDNKSI